MSSVALLCAMWTFADKTLRRTSNFQFLQKALWNNAKFPLLRDMPGLDKHKSIFYVRFLEVVETAVGSNLDT